MPVLLVIGDHEVVLAGSVDTRLGWPACAGLAVALGGLYALPIGLFIR